MRTEMKGKIYKSVVKPVITFAAENQPYTTKKKRNCTLIQGQEHRNRTHMQNGKYSPLGTDIVVKTVRNCLPIEDDQ